jgi:hypothetical protein
LFCQPGYAGSQPILPDGNTELRFRAFLPAGFILTVIFIVYRFLGEAPSVTADKVVQLVLLVPATACFALYVAGRTKKDLIEWILGAVLKPSTARFLGLLLFILALFSTYMAYGPLEGIPKGTDEAAYCFQSRVYASGHLAAPVPDVENPEASFPFRHFVFRNDMWFIVYTPFHSILMAPFSAAGAAPLLGPVEGLLSLLGIFLLIRLWTGETIARVSVILLLLSPFFLFMTSTFMAHNTNLMLVTWCLYCLSRRAKGAAVTWGFAGGFLIGLAFATKPYPILVWLFFIPFAVITCFREKWASILLPAAAAAAIPFTLFLLANSYYTGNPLLTGYDLVRGGKMIGFGPDMAWFPVYGDHAHTPLRGLYNVVRQIASGSSILFGWPFLSLLPFVAALRLARKHSRILLLYLPVVLIMLLMFLHYYPAIDYGPRHYFTFLPVIILLSTLGLREIVRFARRKWGRRGSNAVAVSVACLFLTNLFLYIPEGIELRAGPWHTIDREPAEAVLGVVETPAIVFMQAGELGYPHICSGINFNSPFLDGEIIYCAHQTPEEDTLFMQAYSGRHPYLYWFDGNSFHVEPWTRNLSEILEPTREMEYHTYLHQPPAVETDQ